MSSSVLFTGRRSRRLFGASTRSQVSVRYHAKTARTDDPQTNAQKPPKRRIVVEVPKPKQAEAEDLDQTEGETHSAEKQVPSSKSRRKSNDPHVTTGSIETDTTADGRSSKPVRKTKPLSTASAEPTSFSELPSTGQAVKSFAGLISRWRADAAQSQALKRAEATSQSPARTSTLGPTPAIPVPIPMSTPDPIPVPPRLPTVPRHAPSTQATKSTSSRAAPISNSRAHFSQTQEKKPTRTSHTARPPLRRTLEPPDELLLAEFNRDIGTKNADGALAKFQQLANDNSVSMPRYCVDFLVMLLLEQHRATDAVDVLNTLKRREFRPSITVLDSFITYFHNRARIEAAERIWQDVVAQNVYPLGSTITTMVDIFLTTHNYEGLEALGNHLRQFGKPLPQAYHVAVLCQSVHAGNARESIATYLQSDSPLDDAVIHSVLNELSTSNDASHSLSFLEELVKRQIVITADHLCATVKQLALSGRIDKSHLQRLRGVVVAGRVAVTAQLAEQVAPLALLLGAENLGLQFFKDLERSNQIGSLPIQTRKLYDDLLESSLRSSASSHRASTTQTLADSQVSERKADVMKVSSTLSTNTPQSNSAQANSPQPHIRKVWRVPQSTTQHVVGAPIQPLRTAGKSTPLRPTVSNTSTSEATKPAEHINPVEPPPVDAKQRGGADTALNILQKMFNKPAK